MLWLTVLFVIKMRFTWTRNHYYWAIVVKNYVLPSPPQLNLHHPNSSLLSFRCHKEATKGYLSTRVRQQRLLWNNYTTMNTTSANSTTKHKNFHLFYFICFFWIDKMCSLQPGRMWSLWLLLLSSGRLLALRGPDVPLQKALWDTLQKLPIKVPGSETIRIQSKFLFDYRFYFQR